MQSFLELGHQTGVYDPEKLKELSSKLTIASLSVNSSLPEFAKTLSYSLPTLHAGVGLDADTVIALTAAMQNAGVNSTKSGTWIRSFYQGLLPKMGAKGDDKHNAALQRIGLGSVRNWQVKDGSGNVDWSISTDHATEIMRERTAGMSEAERSGTLHDAFGERGSSIASLMLQKTVQEQFDNIRRKIAGGAEMDLFGQYAENSSLQKAQQTWRDTQNVLIDIGNTTLPAVNTALSSLDSVLKALPDDWDATKKMWQDRAKAAGEFFAPIRAAVSPKGPAAAFGEGVAGTLDQVESGIKSGASGLNLPKRPFTPTPPRFQAAPFSMSPADAIDRMGDRMDEIKKFENGLNGAGFDLGQLDNSAKTLKASFDDLSTKLSKLVGGDHLAGGMGNDDLSDGSGSGSGGSGGGGSGGSSSGGGSGSGSGGRGRAGGNGGSGGRSRGRNGGGAGAGGIARRIRASGRAVRAAAGGGRASGGIGGWWTPERVNHGIDTLKAGGVSDLGARALVARWAGVEAQGGPTTRNSIGAWGIAQWLSPSRRAGIDGNSDYDAQLQHSLKELHSAEGARALRMLNAAQTPEQAATGASQYERAEGYNPKTGADNYVGKTVAAMARLDRGGGSAPTPAGLISKKEYDADQSWIYGLGKSHPLTQAEIDRVAIIKKRDFEYLSKVLRRQGPAQTPAAIARQVHDKASGSDPAPAVEPEEDRATRARPDHRAEARHKAHIVHSSPIINVHGISDPAHVARVVGDHINKSMAGMTYDVDHSVMTT